MSFFTVMIIAVGLAMDAFAVSMAEGLGLRRFSNRDGFNVGLVFGGFQALMPLIGFYIGSMFSDIISSYDHWVAFILLIFVGGKMLWEAKEEKKCETGGKCDISLNLIGLGVATSIDALAVGFSFSFLPNIDVFSSVMIIGIMTFIISFLGVFIGNKFGKLLGSKAEYAGGTVLILIGIKILIEGLGGYKFF